MTHIFEFSDWNQLAGLRSKDYPNLILIVVQFNSKDLVGTRIGILDNETGLTYFEGFVRLITTDRFNPLAVFEIDAMIKRINSYGFNIALKDPISLHPNVIVVLKGLYELGYNYITLQYERTTTTDDKSLYQSDIDVNKYDLYTDNWLPLPTKVISNKYIVASKNLSDTRQKPKKGLLQSLNRDIYIVSGAPEFSWEDYRWVKPTKVYSIELLINPKGTSKNPILDAIIESKDVD